MNSKFIRHLRSRLAEGALFLALCLAPSVQAAGSQIAPEHLDFFESKIRPLLAEQCYGCHGAKTENGPKAGLFLDRRDGWMKGGDHGPAIVPGNPEASLLLRAVRYQDADLRMPPKDKKLSPEQIALLEHWIQIGAPDPRTDAQTAAAAPPLETHWAFQPIRIPPLPPIQRRDWVSSPIDAFILARLEEKGIRPSPKAGKRTLIRRVSLDLTGLPPTPAETQAFLEDASEDAFSKVVERLLASPHYGERWARHWLDIARYADTKGYVFEEERRFPYSYTYRDYVIRSFNEDLPYDRFLIEQIAADHLPLDGDNRPLAALGFLTLGRRFLNNQPDIIDDRIDVVTRGAMGLTVACARCHDHKYDPVPIKDYYSLYGVFASSSEPSEKPLLGSKETPHAYPEYLQERKKRDTELKTYRVEKEAEALSQLRQATGEYLLAAHDASRLEDRSKTESLARERKLDPGALQRWIARLDALKKENPTHPVLGPWISFSALPDAEFAARAKDLLLQLALPAQAANPVNPLVAFALAGDAPQNMKDLSERYGKLFADLDKRWQAVAKLPAAHSIPQDELPFPLVSGFADPHLEAIRAVLYGADSPLQLSSSDIQRVFDVPTRQKIRALQRKLEELDATHPGSPPRAMALIDNAAPQTPRVFLRGNPSNPGPEVPRQFLELLSGPQRQPFQKGSGRLEMAQAIASKDNPLTARVFVNRVWLHYFGAGLVRTPSDFGLRCDPPTHPELLDFLAGNFMENGWSIKNLHRLILLSNAYQQSSAHNEQFAELDPNNQLLWKMNRRRLDLEGFRDSLLAVAGRLNRQAGGRPVELTTAPFTTRRTIYGFIERQNLPGLFRTFDFASPDTTSPQRFSTTVPQQALYMINSPFVIEQARSFAVRPEVRHLSQNEEKIRALYSWAFQRDPEPEELQAALRYLQTQGEKNSNPSAAQDTPDPAQPASKLSPWEKYAQVLLMSNELAFVD